jgi:trk system potassium uptake protein TrkH
LNPKLDARIIGLLAGLIGVMMIPPLVLGQSVGEPIRPFVVAMAIAFLLFGAGAIIGRRAERHMQTRDGFLVVTIGWVVSSALAAVPYLVSGQLGPLDSWFEAVSGITTTGSTVLTDIDAFPRSLLLWRSLTQWLGGMGIILFTIAVLPLLGVGGMQLFKAEVPGPVADKLTPRIATTARYLWSVYVGLTAAELVLLGVGGMPWFEALCHSLTTLATGGFSPKGASIGAYAGPYLRGIVVLFMFLAGMNFVLHFRWLSGKWRDVVRDDEWRWYATLIAVPTLVIGTTLFAAGAEIGPAFGDALFTVVSLVTTTGYATADFEQWPLAITGILGPLLVFGGMAGSTGGGVKTLRTLIALRSIRTSFRKMLHPHAVTPVVYRGRNVGPDVVTAIWGFFAVYIILAVLGMLALNGSGADMVTAWSASLTAIGNVGPGLGDVGPTDSFAWVGSPAKLVLTFLMLCGRLEIYTVVMLFLPGFWRR